HRAVLERAQNSDISEVRADGLFGPPSRFINALDRNRPHSIDFVIGKFNPAKVDLGMVTSAVTQTLALGAGTVIIHHSHGEHVFSAERTCSDCKRGFFKPDPEDLSFNSKRGVCTTCQGSGKDRKEQTCKV